MKNVTIQVSKTMPSHAARDDDDDEKDEEASATPPRAQRPSLSLSMIMTRAIGVIFPLIGIAIFIFSMGGMACDQGNAPAFFCSALDALRAK